MGSGLEVKGLTQTPLTIFACVLRNKENISPDDLVLVYDFWNAELRQLTFHADGGWGLASGGGEERKGRQFVALGSEAPGTVAVYDWWSEKLKKISVHPVSVYVYVYIYIRSVRGASS